MRGGKRPNAGRPQIHPDNKRVQMSLSVSPVTRTRVRSMREDGVPVTAHIEDFIEDLMERWLSGEDL